MGVQRGFRGESVRKEAFPLDNWGIFARIGPNLISLWEENMSYSHTNSKGQKYYLHGKMVNLKGGRRQQIYYFCRDIRAEACDLPANRSVVESPRTGLPLCKKK